MYPALSLLLACADPPEPGVDAQRKALLEQLDSIRSQRVRRSTDPRPDVVLISLDTVRADAIAAYGGLLPYKGQGADATRATPVFDGLAAEGVRFEFALAQAPTTMPSHSAIFTGLDNHGHGVVRNGFRLGTENDTLAERFTAAGFSTIGVIGASVLAESTGISRGFRVWDAQLSHDRNKRHEALAAEVTERALDVIRADESGKPLFLFVHYFDAHGPYNAPAPYTKRFCDPDYSGAFDGSRGSLEATITASRNGMLNPADIAAVRGQYQGEVAYTDTHVGRLLDGLGDRGAARLVAVFGDHGEGMGEDPMNPFGHGGSVDPWSLRVPLMVSGPGVPTGLVAPEQARLMDLGTTLLGLAGVRGKLGDGVDLAERWATASDKGRLSGGDLSPIGQVATPIAYAEASQPHELASKTGWPNLPFARVAYRDGYACQRFPLVSGSPKTFRVVGSEQTTTAATPAMALCDALAEWDRRLPAIAVENIDVSTQEGLKALGYVEEEGPTGSR